MNQTSRRAHRPAFRGLLRVWFSGIGAAFLCGCPENPLTAAYQARDAGEWVLAGNRFVETARGDPANLAAWDGAVDVFCRNRFHVARCLKVLDLELELLGTVERHRDALSQSLEARAEARMQQGLAKAALEDLERAEFAAPDRAPVAVLQARVWMMLGQRDEALEALERAYSLDPNLPTIGPIRALLPAPAATSTQSEGFGGT